MPDTWIIITIIALYIAIPLWTVIKEERERTTENELRAARAKARAELQEKYGSVLLGHRSGKHEVVDLGRLNTGNFYLIRSSEETFTSYFLVLFDFDGTIQKAKVAYGRPDLPSNVHLEIGKRGEDVITYPAQPAASALSSAFKWLYEPLPDYHGEVATDVVFKFADKCLERLTTIVAKEIRADEERLSRELAESEKRRSRELAEAEERRQRAVHENYQRLLDLECWDTDPASLRGVFQRWARGDSQHRGVISIRLNQMMVNHHSELEKLNFHALPEDGRRMFLPVFLGIRVGNNYPVYDLDESKPGDGIHVYICRNGPADAGPWREKAAQINRYLGDRWGFRELDGTRVEMWRLPVVPAQIPFEQKFLAKGKIFLGIDAASAQPVHIPLATMTHTLVCGQTGSGKSVGLNQLQRSLLYNLESIAEIAACDLKGGVDLARFAGLSPKIKFVDSYSDMHDLAECWVGIMKARFADMRAKGETNTTGDYRVLIVDEFSEIGGYEPTKEEKPRHLKLLANLALLAQQGRAAGIRLILQTQAPTADYLPTTIMKNLPSVMCYRMNSRQNITAIFLGHGDTLPADPASFKAGEYLFANGATGVLTHIRTTACHEPDAKALQACLPPAHAA